MSSFYGSGGGITQGGGGDILAEKMYICGANEYDPTLGLPSIANPEQGMFYLVPATNGEENNLFNQFIYKDGKWEKFGSGGLKFSDLVVIAGTGTGSAMTKNGNTASGVNSFAEGGKLNFSTIVIDDKSYTEPGAYGDYSHSEGLNTLAIGYSSHVEGYGTIASGNSSHAEGNGTRASGNFSHAEGSTTTASGFSSHAEGVSTTTSGNCSHAEGSTTTASGHYSHAEGCGATASGNGSHASGFYTVANHKSQHVFGEYNVEDSSTATANNRGNYVEIVGNGTNKTKSNARTLDWDGNEILAGKLTVGSGPTDNMDVATKQYVDQHSGGSAGLQNLVDGSATGSVRGINTVAEDNNYTMGLRAVAEGDSTKASGDNSHAEGSGTTASGNSAHAEGGGVTASGNNSHAEGGGSKALGINSHAEGNGTTASGEYSHAEGSTTTASKTAAHAEGSGNTASGDYSHAEGNGTSASGSYSHVEGGGTSASGAGSHAEGESTSASGQGSHAEGNDVTAVGKYSHAEGITLSFSTKTIDDKSYTRAGSYGDYSHSEGQNNLAIGIFSHTEGIDNVASEDAAHAEGAASTASGNYSHAEGFSTTASGASSHAEGIGTSASGEGSHVEGNNIVASGASSHAEGASSNFSTKVINGTSYTRAGSYGDYSHSEGVNNLAIGNYSHAEGSNTYASGSYSHAEGSTTTASKAAAHAEGQGTIASGYNSHAEGNGTTASGNYSHAEGQGTTASGNYSHTEGQGTTAEGQRSHAEGAGSHAEGVGSHAEGSGTTAFGICSHAEGASSNFSTKTIDDKEYTRAGSYGDYSHSEGLNNLAIGNYSHSEGRDTYASGSYSHAEGCGATASGNGSHASGFYTVANHKSQHVFGEYNVEDPSTALSNARGNYVEIVGNGTAGSSRSNARTLDWNGNEVLAGKITVGSNPTGNMDVTTKGYVDNEINNLESKNLITNETKGILLNILKHLAFTDSLGEDLYESLYDSLYPNNMVSYQLLQDSDFMESRGFSNFTVTDGNIVYDASNTAQYSVGMLDIGVEKIKIDIDDNSNFSPGAWTVFGKVDGNTYYATNGDMTNPKLYILKYNTSTSSFSATEDNTIATLTQGEGSANTSKIIIKQSDGLFQLYNSTMELIYSITNSNCIGFWLGNTMNNGSFWNNVRIRYGLRPVTMEDIVEQRTVPITIDENGTIAPNYSNGAAWLFTFSEKITEIRFLYSLGYIARNYCLIYKKVDDNYYYGTNGDACFIYRLSSDSTTGTDVFGINSLSNENDITRINEDKKDLRVGTDYYVTATLKDNKIKISNPFGYEIIINDANCLGVWAQSQLAEFKYIRVREEDV